MGAGLLGPALVLASANAAEGRWEEGFEGGLGQWAWWKREGRGAGREGRRGEGEGLVGSGSGRTEVGPAAVVEAVVGVGGGGVDAAVAGGVVAGGGDAT